MDAKTLEDCLTLLLYLKSQLPHDESEPVILCRRLGLRLAYLLVHHPDTPHSRRSQHLTLLQSLSQKLGPLEPLPDSPPSQQIHSLLIPTRMTSS